MKNQQLSLDLIEAQYNFKNSKKSLLIIIGGIELTKKSNAIKKLSELMDPRYLKIKADLPNKIKSNSLIWSPYINDIPKRGEIVTFYGNWYTDLLASTLYENTKKSDYYFKEHLEKINIFENYLKTIVFIRNICAHNDLLYDSNTAKEIETTPMIIFNNNNRHSLDSSIKVILYFLGQVSANRRNEVQKEIDIIFREHQSNPIISTILTEKSNYRF